MPDGGELTSGRGRPGLEVALWRDARATATSSRCASGTPGRDPGGGPRPHLHPVLHDQEEGDGARPGHLPAHREDSTAAPSRLRSTPGQGADVLGDPAAASRPCGEGRGQARPAARACRRGRATRDGRRRAAGQPAEPRRRADCGNEPLSPRACYGTARVARPRRRRRAELAQGARRACSAAKGTRSPPPRTGSRRSRSCRRRAVHVVVTNLRMPGLGGMEVLAARARRTTRDVPSS